MSELYLYRPDVCDGDYCPHDCDKCQKRFDAKEEQDLEEEYG